MKTSISLVAVVVLSLSTITNSQPLFETFKFFNITHNYSGDPNIGESQLFVDIWDFSGQAKFTFRNLETGISSSIAEIYFDDDTIGGTLMAIDQIIDTPPTVDFIYGNVKPKGLPGGKSLVPNFIPTESFSLEAQNPTPQHGVNPGEDVSVVFNLNDGKDYFDVINSLTSGQLRIGLHVQSFAPCDTSDSFITTTPEPATTVFLGLGGLVLMRNRHKKRQ